MKKVEELDVFKLSHSLTLEIYRITKSFPDEEKFGLISQMRKAAYSIPMNLMEGAHRLSVSFGDGGNPSPSGEVLLAIGFKTLSYLPP
jgi:hypothetical protein